MAGSKTLKNRIRATKNIKQMTRAMEAVSAVKMRRAQGLALRARPYALAALEILRGVRKATGTDSASLSALLTVRPVARTAIAFITSDKGLAGSFNAAILRRVERLIAEAQHPVSLIAIGKKGRDYFARRGATLHAQFLGAGDFGTIEETDEIAQSIRDVFTTHAADEVILVYTNFISALKQDVIVKTLLPFSESSLQEIVDSIVPLRGRYANMPKALGTIDMSGTKTFIFEPSPQRILEELLPELLSIQIFHAILEANASEHSSRMVAMKNASESAGDLIESLTIEFNKARQALITKELAEITAGKEALNV